MSCTSSRACIAVGSFTPPGGADVALAERWNGVRWAIQATPKLPGEKVDLSGVSCSSRKACTAVGTFSLAMGQTPTQLTPSQLVERWNGVRWAIQHTPLVSHGSGLTGVSCPSRRVCIAVGEGSDVGGPPQLLTERWNGVRWKIEHAPLPAGVVGVVSGGVSCPSSDVCTAVGQPIGSPTLLAERWDGVSWTFQTPPSLPATSEDLLSGVSCTSSDACIAVGSGAYAELWSGGSWTVQNTLSPTGT